MPVEPPAAGPDRAPPPEPGAVGVAVGVDVAAAEDPDADAADDVDAEKTPRPATAQVIPAATIHVPFFLGSDRQAPARCAGTAVVAGPAPVVERPVVSWSFMMALLFAWSTPGT
jgi:hypothetical protein